MFLLLKMYDNERRYPNESQINYNILHLLAKKNRIDLVKKILEAIKLDSGNITELLISYSGSFQSQWTYSVIYYISECLLFVGNKIAEQVDEIIAIIGLVNIEDKVKILKHQDCGILQACIKHGTPQQIYDLLKGANMDDRIKILTRASIHSAEQGAPIKVVFWMQMKLIAIN